MSGFGISIGCWALAAMLFVLGTRAVQRGFYDTIGMTVLFGTAWIWI